MGLPWGMDGFQFLSLPFSNLMILWGPQAETRSCRNVWVFTIIVACFIIQEQLDGLSVWVPRRHFWNFGSHQAMFMHQRYHQAIILEKGDVGFDFFLPLTKLCSLCVRRRIGSQKGPYSYSHVQPLKRTYCMLLSCVTLKNGKETAYLSSPSMLLSCDTKKRERRSIYF